MALIAKIPSPQYLAFAEQFVAGHPSVETGSLFGMRCLKSQGKAFAGGFADGLVVKLDDATLSEASALEGAVPFDPSGGRPMKAWVVIPLAHHDRWPEFAEAAYRAVGA